MFYVPIVKMRILNPKEKNTQETQGIVDASDGKFTVKTSDGKISYSTSLNSAKLFIGQWKKMFDQLKNANRDPRSPSLQTFPVEGLDKSHSFVIEQFPETEDRFQLTFSSDTTDEFWMAVSERELEKILVILRA